MAKPRFEVAVGLFVVIGFLILSLIVFFVSGVYFFRPGYHLKAQFDYVGILNQGAPVRFAGFRVGEVTNVALLDGEKEGAATRVEVAFFVEKKVIIKDHYEVSVRGNHIMSEPHLAITPAAGDGRVLQDGDIIPNGISPQSMDDLFQHGSMILERLDKMLADVSGFLEDEETRKMLREAVQNMSELLESMNQIIRGNEEEFQSLVVNMNRASSEMVTLLETINQGDGTIGKLIKEDEIYVDMRDFVHEIKLHPWRLFKKK